MSLSRWPPNPVKVARQTFYTFLVLAVVGFICGPLFVFRGIHSNQRDRHSLQWPKTTGKMMQCDEIYHPGGRHSSGTYGIDTTYTYFVNNQRYVGHRITLWSQDLRGRTGNFAATHPISSVVDVYYDPNNPGNAVLIPGADELGNRMFIYGGCVMFACGIIMAFRLPRKFAVYKGQMEQEKAAAHGPVRKMLL